MVLPAPEEARVLRACVLGGDVRGTDLREPELRRSALLPMLLDAVQRRGALVDDDLLAGLRVARAHEDLRVRTIRVACREVLEQAGPEPLVSGGIPVAVTAYPEWPLRHCHDLDLLVDDGAGDEIHPLKLHVKRHESLYPARFGGPTVATVRARSVAADIAGVPVRVLAPADMFVHVLGRAACGPFALRWAVDAWWLADRHRDLDATLAGEHVAATRLAPAIALLARWLADELEAPVSPAVLETLDAAAERAGGADARAVVRWRTPQSMPRRVASRAVRRVRRA